MTQQELGQAMSRAQDVLALVLTGPQQVTHGLLGRRRHSDRGELPGAEQARELAGVTTVGLDAVTRSSRGERGRDDGGVHAEGGQLAVQVIAGGPGLVAGSYLRGLGPAAHEPSDILVGVGDSFLIEMAIGAEQGHADAGLADVEADVGRGRMLEHGRRPPYVAPSASPRMIHDVTQAPASPC